MSFFAAAGFTIFILILFSGIFLNLYGLPGTVVIFFDVLLYALFTGFENVGIKILLFLFFSAAIAETIEFFWVVSETPQQLPASQKLSVKASILGAITGAFLLTPFFWGPGTWAGFFLGGLAGVLIAEIIRQYQLKAPNRTLNSVIFNIVGKNMVKGFISLCMIAFSLSNIYS
ncbi:MAG TPA: DUF456 domain-containing protein [Smithella sp.]|nr:DUF456 domain-containing protein [Smithella sp.]HOG91402.1 DUF456 domain-containing protein [Smithella sp.]